MKKLSPVLFAVVFLASCGARKEEPATKSAPSAPPVPVETVTATKAAWPEVYEAAGAVRARTTGAISAKVMGYVREVKVQAGDGVQAGQLLVEIDSRDIDAQVRQAEAVQREAEEALPEVDTAIASARVNLELIGKTFNRMKDLFEKKSISSQEFDEATARLKVAQAGCDAAAAKRKQVVARVSQAAEAVKAAEIMRGYAKIAAPFDGTVIEKRVEPGNLTAPGAPLLTIEQAGAYRLEVSVEESRGSSIRAGTPVAVSLEALQRTFHARVTEIVPAVDSSSRTFTVKIDLPAMAGLQSGMFGRALFRSGSREVLAIPSGAVRDQGQVTSVLALEEGAARGRLVTLGQRNGDQVEVLSGLAPGDKVVFPRPAGLADGARVKVRP
jgi:RND family efflux transporter MFP subunit